MLWRQAPPAAEAACPHVAAAAAGPPPAATLNAPLLKLTLPAPGNCTAAATGICTAVAGAGAAGVGPPDRRMRSMRAPMTWPMTAQATVQAMAHLGMTTALRSIAMKGMVACTARNHSGLNLRTCTRLAPDGRLAAPVKAPMASSLIGSACGRSARTGLSRATAARADTIAAGHFNSRAAPAASSALTCRARPLSPNLPPRNLPPLRSLPLLNLPLLNFPPRSLPLPSLPPRAEWLPRPAAGMLLRACCAVPPAPEEAWLDAGRCLRGFGLLGFRCACARHQSPRPDYGKDADQRPDMGPG